MKTAIVSACVFLGLSACLWGTAFDGEQVYNNNCTRCHRTLRAYSQKMSRSIVRHMRIKAMLTKPEADAVLAYLSERASASAGPQVRAGRQ